MAIKYAYHPGNVSHSSSPEVAVTMESFARAMGIILVPLPGATSCGAGIVRHDSTTFFSKPEYACTIYQFIF